ncbi:MAG: hypothetical protein WKF94_08975 [Solirubrobacteraceae bacterium]
MRVLFVLLSPGFGRLFEAGLSRIAERGHDLDIAFTTSARKVEASDTTYFDALVERHPRVTWRAVAIEDDAWSGFASSIRHTLDWMRYLDPLYEDAFSLRARAEARVHPALRATILEAGDERRRRLAGVMRAMERALPIPAEYERLLDEVEPDLIAVTPMIDMGSSQVDLVRAARRRGISTALPVASWDNLTNKGVIREPPDRTLVWNAAQAREAVELHGVPPDSVIVTGAHTYDHWFGRRPSAKREEFCAKVGLPADRPYVLYLGSSYFIAPDEVRVIRRWLRGLRDHGGPLSDAGVLVRPHPANLQPWEELDWLDPELTRIWPRHGAIPVDDDSKAGFFDSIFHSVAVVGINTSAQIETAIVGRPVLTFLADDVADGQTGTLHFEHLRAAGGKGLLHVADTLDEHLGQLAGLVADGGGAERNGSFLEAFVRPHGLDVPAGPRFVDALEELARTWVRPIPESRAQRALRSVLEPVVRAGRMPLAELQAFGVGAERGTKRARRLDRSRRRILFVLDQPGLVLHFDETVRALAARGHDVHLAFGREKWSESLGALDVSGLQGRVTIDRQVPLRRDAYTRYARRLRALTDYVHYLQPQLYEAGWARAKKRAGKLPSIADPLRQRDELPAGTAALALRVLRRFEQAIPSDPVVERFLARADPDVVVVSPLVLANAYQTDVIKSARRLGRPTLLAVSSWDNLSSKGRVRIEPDRISVWNPTQLAEATAYHQLSPDRLEVTGAQPFDRWFDREPSRSRVGFCRDLSLAPEQPYLLFVGSTRQGYPPDGELLFARALVGALRTSEDERVRELQVLVRPHPSDFQRWADADLSDLAPMVIARRDNPLPVLADDRSAYFDSLYHAAAVVGLNSSAMIEAAVVGRPVHTVSLPEWHDMQHNLLHFRYMLQENGGFLREATTFREHTDLLAEDLRDPTPTLEQNRRFVESFVRPGGIDVAATDRLADAIEGLAAERPTPQPPKPDPIDRLAVSWVVGVVAADRARLQMVKATERRLPKVTGRLRDRAKAARVAAADDRTLASGFTARLGGASMERAADLGDKLTTASRQWLKERGERVSKPKKTKKATAEGMAASLMTPPDVTKGVPAEKTARRAKAANTTQPAKAEKTTKAAKPVKAAEPVKAEKTIKSPRGEKTAKTTDSGFDGSWELASLLLASPTEEPDLVLAG